MALRQATPTGRDGGEGLTRLIVRYTRTGYVTVLAMFVLLSVSTGYVLQSVNKDVRGDAERHMEGRTHLSAQVLSAWFEATARVAEALAQAPEVRAPWSTQTESRSLQRFLRARLGWLDAKGFVLLAADARVLAASNPVLQEAAVRAAGQHPARLARVRQGETLMLTGARQTGSDRISQRSQDGVYIFLATPVRDEGGGVLGALLLALDMETVGATIHAGNAAASAARISILVPAGSAQGRAGDDPDIIAASRRDDRLDLIVHSEMSTQDALASYYEIRNLVWLIFFMAIALVFLLLLLLIRFRRRVAHLSKISSLDPLTQLANRRRFDRELAEQWQVSSRSKLPISLILIDVDCFKAYNDYYGHQAGDGCLRSVAKTLAACVKRSQDLVVRYGGEEFAVLLPMTTANSALIIARHIQRRIMDLRIEHCSSTVADIVTVSMGVATLQAQARTDAKVLIEKADEYLYMAKEAGRNRIVTTPRSEQETHSVGAAL